MAAKKCLNLTVEEALAEVTALLAPEQRKMGDLDTRQLAKFWKVSSRTARDRMQKLVDEMKFIHIRVLDTDTGKINWIYRRRR